MVISTDFFPERANRVIQPKRIPIMTKKKYPISEGVTLLKGHKELINLQHMLTSYLRMPTRYAYEQFCQPVLERFAELVQCLPASEKQYYINSGGILLHALDRAMNACQIYHRQLDLEEGATLTSGQALWTYVVFTSALLHRAGHFLHQLSVTLYADNNELTWQPLLGLMEESGDCYCYEFKPSDQKIARVHTLVLAHQILPKQALAWLSQRDDVYKVWLSMLEEDWTSVGGSMARIIPLANIASVESYFNKIAYQRLELKPQPVHPDRINNKQLDDRFTQTASTFAEKNNTNTVLTQEAGVAFLQWLRQNAQGLSLNNVARSPAILGQDGSLLLAFPQTTDLVKQFLSKHSEYGTVGNVIEQFMELGITLADANNEHLRKVKIGDDTQFRKALIIKHADIIFTGGTPVEARVPYVPVSGEVRVEAAGSLQAIEAIDIEEAVVNPQVHHSPGSAST